MLGSIPHILLVLRTVLGMQWKLMNICAMNEDS